ncbi:MAG: class I SAM-dependent methyltransferase, partial [Candidatus Krumholzibacteriota bacterium]|nr:class I SAM-dependent methyltransferase [Candidatus Krumholzibacteriota bacterium]
AFYDELARREGGSVIELGCGTGRVLIPLARAGHTVLGLDSSAPMISLCREKLMDEPEPVRERARLMIADMRRFDVGRSFRLAIVAFRSFQHLLAVEDQRACLDCVSRHLLDRGLLILNLFNPDLDRLTDERRSEEQGDEPPFELPDGRRVRRTWRNPAVDLFNQVLDCELIYHVTHPGGREERLVHSFPIRYLFRYEAEHLLARCGFEVEDVYADFERNPVGSRVPGELIFLARKR